MKKYTLEELVKMAFTVQKHKHSKDEIPNLLAAFEMALTGFNQEQIQEAFITYIRHTPSMPTPSEIITILFCEKKGN